MGVPKFFRWISERYPKINCPLHCPPSAETRKEYFGDNQIDVLTLTPSKVNDGLDPKEMAVKSCILPEFDRLYLDMNGIIHCCSHNNASELNTAIDPDVHIDSISNASPEDVVKGSVPISEEDIFNNVAYYLDRIVCDIVQPKELVYLSIDGVAPRAKMNQQRGRRYRSGQEKEIEDVFYGAIHQQRNVNTNDPVTFANEQVADDSSAFPQPSTELIQEVEPGRFAGTFQTSPSVTEPDHLASSSFDLEFDEYMRSSDKEEEDVNDLFFHSNAITPGTRFFQNFSARLEQHLKHKLKSDSRWGHLTVYLSGPNVPGEGEHKIMDFIRREQKKKGYDGSIRHCLYGQDGDLIMLGLTTHEKNFCLLREEVIFDQARRRKRTQLASLTTSRESEGGTPENLDKPQIHQGSKATLMNSIDSYINNDSFELLHMSILRDYLAYEFETKDVLNENSLFELEPTIDDFVFMTFFVGNDFLPHMPALDIQDEAFELLFYAYKRNRHKWVLGDHAKSKDSKDDDIRSNHPYLTRKGDIVSGKRLESFLRTIGSYEDPYYDNKKRQENFFNGRTKKADESSGSEQSVPSDQTISEKEEFNRSKYRNMLESFVLDQDKQEANEIRNASFTPVTSYFSLLSKARSKKMVFKPEENIEVDEGLITKMGSLIKNSLTPNTGSASSIDITETNLKSISDMMDRDLKGRYYYEKFHFSPFDEEKHLKLRQSYIEGLCWTLAYYYKGCQDWEWYYPYHYGPMLSDLINIESYLNNISFPRKHTEPLKPFEQLMACLPPSSSYLLPKPFRWLMRSSKSPLKEFYPQSFTVDMNGKRWPWEAVILLPFIDSKRLIQAVNDFVTVNHLSPEESNRNVLCDELVFDGYALGVRQNADEIENADLLDDFAINPFQNASNRPGFPSLREAPVQRLIRRKAGINIFGMRSRYKSAILQIDSEIPAVPAATVLAPKFIGTTVFFRYPFFQEGFVTAVSDAEGIVRGNEGYQEWTSQEKEMWLHRNSTLVDQSETGEGITGSGGCTFFNGNCIFYIRPLKGIKSLADGSKVKVYARFEVDVPIVSCLWNPVRPDPRIVGLPALLEKNPFRYGPKLALERQSFNTARDIKQIRARSMSKAPLSTIAMQSTPWCNNSYPIQLPDAINSKRWKPIYKPLPSFKRTYGVKTAVLTTVALAFTFFSRPTTARGETVPSPIMNTQHIHFYDLFDPLADNIHQTGVSEESHAIHGGRQRTPPLEFAHGTTTLSFTFADGIIAAVDSRASMGNFVGSKTTKKILEVNDNILGTMAGGAADCSFWIRKLQSEAKYHQLSEGEGITVARASKILANALYRNRGADLSIGTMIMGYDDHYGPSIYYVDSQGIRTFGDMFAVGSGSSFALGILDIERRSNMQENEAIALGIKAIRHATFRDAYSGGFISVYVIKKQGWKKVFSEDIAASIS